jgi:hypothetical protein
VPEILTLNLAWEGDPMPSDIFKMLNSIPIILNTQDIFNYKDK